MQTNNTKSSLRAFQVLPGGLARDNALDDPKIEARAVKQFVESLPTAFLSEQSSSTRELLEKLVIKQSALQSIVRVVKHSPQPPRQGQGS